MRFNSAMRTAVSIGLMSVLAACGGGGGDNADEAPDTLAAPNSVVILDKGNSSVQNSTYALPASSSMAYQGASGVQSIGDLLLIVTQDAAFETILIYAGNDHRKYVVGLFDLAGNSYGCRSRNFTTAELQTLANRVNVGPVGNLAICNKTVTVNHTGRQASYANLTLPADDGTRNRITLSADFAWPIPLTN